MGLLEVVVQVEAGIEVMVSQEVEVTHQARTARVAVAVTPQPPHKTPPQLSTKLRENVFVAWNPGGHTWSQCKARIPPAPEQTSGGGAQGQNNGGETVCCICY